MTNERTPKIFWLDFATKLVEKLNQDPEEDWKYKVKKISKDKANILVYDQNNEFLGHF